MKKIYTLVVLLLMSGFIFAQVRQKPNKNFSAVKVTNEINNLPASTRAIVDSLRYDGANADGVGAGAGTFGVYAFFSAATLTAHNALGNTITSVKLYINGIANVTSSELRFYSDQGTTLVYSQVFTGVEGWNNVVLTTPLAIPTTDLYIGYSLVSTGQYPLGCDAGPTNPNGNWIAYNGTWYHLTDLNPALIANWNIRAMVDGTPLVNPVANCTPLTWGAEWVAVSGSKTSANFTLSNTGGGTLTVSSITGLSAPFTTSLVPASVNLTNGQSTTFTFTYSPTVVGVNNQTAVINTNGGNVSITLSGSGITCGTISTYPYNEGFENAFPPNCWSINDVDGDTHNWEKSAYKSHGGTNVAASASFDNPTLSALTPNNYLITPQLNINNSSLELKYWVTAQDANYPAEHYSVLVSTTGIAPADFTEVFNETLVDSTFREKTISLSAYNGQNIYIAFRHHSCTDLFVMKIDDVKIDLGIGISENKKPSLYVYLEQSYGTLYIRNSTNPYVEIYNVLGELVVKSNQKAVDINSLSQGLYIVKVIDNNNTIMSKINLIK